MFAAYHQTCQPTIFSSTVSTSRRADALPPTGSVHLVGQDTTGGRGSRVHNRLAVVIGAGSLVVEVATTLAGWAQQWVSEWGWFIGLMCLRVLVPAHLNPSCYTVVCYVWSVCVCVCGADDVRDEANLCTAHCAAVQPLTAAVHWSTMGWSIIGLRALVFWRLLCFRLAANGWFAAVSVYAVWLHLLFVESFY